MDSPAKIDPTARTRSVTNGKAPQVTLADIKLYKQNSLKEFEAQMDSYIASLALDDRGYVTKEPTLMDTDGDDGSEEELDSDEDFRFVRESVPSTSENSSFRPIKPTVSKK